MAVRETISQAAHVGRNSEPKSQETLVLSKWDLKGLKVAGMSLPSGADVRLRTHLSLTKSREMLSVARILDKNDQG